MGWRFSPTSCFPCIRYFQVDDGIDIEAGRKVPYRIEIVGVTCDPGLAVARGIWRQVSLFQCKVFPSPSGFPIESVWDGCS